MSNQLEALKDDETVAIHQGAIHQGAVQPGLRCLLPSATLPGTEGDDTIIGSEENDLIEGLAGNDLLSGEGGDDRLEGGTGDDTLQGGLGNDQLVDGEGADRAFGGEGRDLFIAGVDDGAADVFDGGAGIDRVSLEHVRGGMTVDLANQQMFKTDSSDVTDSIVNIENVSGTGFADTIIGDAGNNILGGSGGADFIDGGDGGDFLRGGTGDDTLVGGAGVNTLHGGGNIDTADYSRAAGAVIVDLAAGTAESNGEGASDTLISIENVIGSDNDDGLTGDENANRLEGRLGEDTLNGGAGNDTLDGGDGDDLLIDGDGADLVLGGAGRDLFIASVEDGAADTLDGGDGIDRLSLEHVRGGMTVDLANQQMFKTDGSDVTDTIVNIENVSGSGFADTIIGDAGNNILGGSGGADFIDGGDGGDFLRGGTGDDTLIGGAGINTLIGGGNNDVLIAEGQGDDLADVMIGGSGHDVFKLLGSGEIARITDFQSAGDSQDSLDLSDLLEDVPADATGADLADFLRISSDGTDTVIEIDLDGAVGGVAYDDASVTLSGIDLTGLGNSQEEILQSLLDNQLLTV